MLKHPVQRRCPATVVGGAVRRRPRGDLHAVKFHTATLPPAARPKAYETPNGIDPSFLVDGDNGDGLRVGPRRTAASEVLKGWPAVRGRVPNATLVVYYGFSPAFVTWGARHIPFGVAAEVERLLRSRALCANQIFNPTSMPGVDYRGMVGHDELARGYARAGFVLYPTTYPETGCVSVMKAMALGAIDHEPLRGSVVPELTVDFDLGPATPRRADAEASILLDDLKPAVDAADVAWQADFAARRGLAER
ncbi:protein N-acetylglucosaminyltransferase [Aureococcus anophagefferens]|nr:protein N-acetylglucosaminyltransferase [Aureococcus anophagefferens]